MKERPILFSGAMVRAILDGRKTVTRRVVKPWQAPARQEDGEWYAVAQRHPRWGFGVSGLTAEACADELATSGCCPYGRPGERLWVRETFNRSNPGGAEGIYYYRAEGQFPAAMGGSRFYGNEAWKPSIHMPRAASRILLEITAVRVERLQDISEEQAVQEGFYQAVRECDSGIGQDVVGWFRELWRSINGAESWDSNPWVWVVEFKRVEASDV